MPIPQDAPDLRLRLQHFTLYGKKIPDYMHEDLINYLIYRKPPGPFLFAVLANDLRAAVEQGDVDNLFALPLYIVFLFGYAHHSAWGSYDNVREWCSLTES